MSQTAPLHLEETDKGRLQIGISWDVGEKTVEKGFFFKKQVKVPETYDLDIFCCMFDAQKQYVDKVTPENANLIDKSGEVFHSGDNTTGRVSGDDEYISANMHMLPEHIQSLAIFATVNEGKTFQDILNPFIRVADGKTDEDQISIHPDKAAEGHKNALLYAIIYRDNTAKSGWALKEISKFYNDNEIEDWTSLIQKFLP